MTRNYNRSEIINFFDLPEKLQNEVKLDFHLEDEDAENELYVISIFKGGKTAIPLSIFSRTEKNNFTHGIYSDTYFSGYYITINRSNDEAVIAYKYF